MALVRQDQHSGAGDRCDDLLRAPPGAARPPQTGVTAPAAAGDSAAGQIGPSDPARQTILAPRRYCHAKMHRRLPEPHHRSPATPLRIAFMDGH
jgi:hypothetical protein